MVALEIVQTITASPPRYRFDAANHIHLLDNRPLMGTSTVVDCLSKELTWWAAGMAVCKVFGIPNAKWLTLYKNRKLSRDNQATMLEKIAEALAVIKTMTPLEALALAVTAYRAHYDHKEATAADGTDMHASLARYVQDCIDDNQGEPCRLLKYGHTAVETFADWATENVKQFLWSEKHCYSERLWVGGISDCGALLMDESQAIIDFKSSKDAYFSQFVQVGGYAVEIEENGIYDSDGNFLGQSGRGLFGINKLIIWPFRGSKPRTEPAGPFMERFAEVCRIYKHQQEYENHS